MGVTSDFRSGGHGDFELLTIEGGELVHYFHDNGDVNSPWRKGHVVAPGIQATRAGLVQSDFVSGGHGNFEAVALNGDSVRHFVRDNSNVSKPWEPAQVVSPVVRSQKICQLTNDVDLQTAAPTVSLTESRFGVSGTDLGYPFMHDGRQYFAFGDTASGNHNTPGDSLAFTRDVDPEGCLHLKFVSDGDRFRPIAAPGVSMGFFEVPTTGFSYGGHMYVFVWTDHRDLGNGQFTDPIGHAALLRSDDNGRTFRLIWGRLGDQLVYLAVSIVDNSALPGSGLGAGQSLVLWGSVKMYRLSNPHLAILPLDQVENKNAVRYFNGFCQTEHHTSEALLTPIRISAACSNRPASANCPSSGIAISKIGS